MKIAIDCRSLRKKPVGVPNFLISFIKEIANQHPDWSFYLLSNEDFSEEAKSRLPDNKSIHKVIAPLPVIPRIAVIWYLIKLPILVSRLDVNLFLTPIPNLPIFLFRKAKTLIVVHDMVYKLFPKTMSFQNWLINFFLHDRSFRKADYIWAVSNYTKTETEAFFPTRKCSKIFVGSSIDKSIFFKADISEKRKSELLSRLNLNQKFLLFVGTLEPRKNLSFLLSLLPDLINNGFELLIVGAKGWGKDKLPELESLTDIQRTKIKFSGFISNDDLAVSYAAASVYVSTSLNEGFGLPQLEAMSCGCPVVTSHNSAMIEIAEGAGETVKGWEKNDWISAIIKVTANREAYVKRGLQRAQEYNWETVIKNLTLYLEENQGH